MSRASDLRRLVQTELADVHTCLPGSVVSFDGSLAVVRPAISKQMSDGSELPAPAIVSVPVCFPCGAGGRALISVPMMAGDPVLLHFTERALESWLSGTDGVPGDPRMFDLTDAFATPVCRPGVQQIDTQNVVIRFDQASIMIAPDGAVAITTPSNASISAPGGLTVDADVTVNGRIDASGDVIGAGISLHSHIHGQVQPGSGTSGTPQ